MSGRIPRLVRWYRRCLRLLPGPIRRNYGSQMLAVFEQVVRRREVEAGGLAAHVAAGRMFLDLAWRAVVERTSPSPSRAAGRPYPPAPATTAGEIMGNLMRDVRLAGRTLGRNPTYAAVVVLTLALGIGANTAIFTVVRGVMLRPLAFTEPDRLAALWLEFRGHGNAPGMEIPASEPEFLEYAEQNTSFEAIAGFWVGRADIGGIEEPIRVGYAGVSANFLDVLGVAPLLGRGFAEGEDRPGAERVAVLGYDLWRQTFGADTSLVGRDILVSGRPATVAGVLPPSFRFPGETVQLLVPNVLDPANPAGRTSHYLYMVGRLRPGIDVETARRETAALLERWERENPDRHAASPTHPVALAGLRDRVIGDARPALLLLAGAVSLVLLIACVNVANLMMIRMESGRRELGIRSALGASRGQLVRQALTESVVIALAGGAVGLALAAAGVGAFVRSDAIDLPRLGAVRVDAFVLSFTVVASLLTGVLFGLAPALNAARRDPGSVFRLGAGGTVSAGRLGFRRGLVVAEVALAIVLVVGAGLMIRSLQRLHDVDPGFDPDGVSTYDISLNTTAYGSAAEVTDFHQRLVERVRGLPGTVSAGAVRALPLRATPGLETVEFLDRPVDADGERHYNVQYQVADYGLFDALRIPLREGRLFTASDAAGAPPVALVNETLARELWPTGSPIGERVRFGVGNTSNPILTIVGVVGDIRQGGLDASVSPQLFVPHRQAGAIYGGMGTRATTFVVRSTAEPGAAMPAVRSVIRELDASLAISNVQTMERTLVRSIADRRLFGNLLTGFAILALALGAVGIYGLMAYTVASRRREIGLRIALGADRGRVIGMIGRQVLLLTGAGVAIGLAGALATARLLNSFVFETSPRDPVVLFGAPALLVGTAIVAALVPARRATRVDPMEAIRTD